MYIHKLILILALGEPSFVIFFIHLKCKKNNKCISEQQYISTERRQNPRERSDTMKGNCVCVFVCVCAHAYTLPIRSICLLSHRPVKKDDTKHLSSHVLLTQKLPNGRQEKKRERKPCAFTLKIKPSKILPENSGPSCHLCCLSIVQNSQCALDYKAIPASVWHLSSQHMRVKPRNELLAQRTIKVVRQQSTRADFCWGKCLHISWLFFILHLLFWHSLLF